MRMRITATALAVLTTLLSGCEKPDNVKNADDKTPVRYVICGANETNCFVSARFAKMDSCERHKKWSEMLCDSDTKPGMMICTQPSPDKEVSFAYCTM